MIVRVTLNNDVVFINNNVHAVLTDMHKEALANPNPVIPSVPSLNAGVSSYISWVANRIYRVTRADLSIQDNARFLVDCVKHGWLKSVTFETDYEQSSNQDVWNILSIDDAFTAEYLIATGTLEPPEPPE